ATAPPTSPAASCRWRAAARWRCEATGWERAARVAIAWSLIVVRARFYAPVSLPCSAERTAGEEERGGGEFADRGGVKQRASGHRRGDARAEGRRLGARRR